MGSKRDLKCEMVHDGETRRSEDALGEVMINGMSAAVVVDAMDGGDGRGCHDDDVMCAGVQVDANAEEIG